MDQQEIRRVAQLYADLAREWVAYYTTLGELNQKVADGLLDIYKVTWPVAPKWPKEPPIVWILSNGSSIPARGQGIPS